MPKKLSLDNETLFNYIKKRIIIRRKDVAKNFDVSVDVISNRLRSHGILYSMNGKKNKAMTLFQIIKSKLDENGLCNINGYVFSKYKDIKDTITMLINQSSSGLFVVEINKKLKTINSF